MSPVKETILNSLQKTNLFVNVFPLFATLKDKTSKLHILLIKVIIIKNYNQLGDRFIEYNFQIEHYLNVKNRKTE